MKDPKIDVWAETLLDLLKPCQRRESRIQILEEMLARERIERPLVISAGELMAMKFADYGAKTEAKALMVQILVRSITNNHSPEDAAKILFRDHYGYSTGSGWLPDYLDGLPGIKVDMEKCVAIAKGQEIEKT